MPVLLNSYKNSSILFFLFTYDIIEKYEFWLKWGQI